MTTKRKVILVTDGDVYAAKTIEYAASQVGAMYFTIKGNPPFALARSLSS